VQNSNEEGKKPVASQQPSPPRWQHVYEWMYGAKSTCEPSEQQKPWLEEVISVHCLQWKWYESDDTDGGTGLSCDDFRRPLSFNGLFLAVVVDLICAMSAWDVLGCR
jgi:hypothetical protein